MRRKSLPSLEEEGEESLINLTPLIDVVFVVLITFMLIAPVLEIDFVELASGAGTSKKEPASTSLSISIRADNSIWLKGKKISLAELDQTLKKEKKLHPGEAPQIIPDRHAHFETYQAVKNGLELCGFEQMDVVLQP